MFLAGVYAVAGHATGVAVAVQVVVASLAAPFTSLLARELSLPHRVGMLAGLAVALDPVSALTANHLLTDTIFTTIVVASIWTLARHTRTLWWRWHVIAAMGVALGALTRPIGQYLPLALLAPLVLSGPRPTLRRAVPAALAFLLVSTLLMSAWSYRNYRENGVFTLSTINSYNLLHWRAGKVVSWDEGMDFQEARFQHQTRAGVQDAWPTRTSRGLRQGYPVRSAERHAGGATGHDAVEPAAGRRGVSRRRDRRGLALCEKELETVGAPARGDRLLCGHFFRR